MSQSTNYKFLPITLEVFVDTFHTFFTEATIYKDEYFKYLTQNKEHHQYGEFKTLENWFNAHTQ